MSYKNIIKNIMPSLLLKIKIIIFFKGLTISNLKKNVPIIIQVIITNSLVLKISNIVSPHFYYLFLKLYLLFT